MNPEKLVKHTQFIQRFSRKLVHDAHLAEDLSQEAILAFMIEPSERIRNIRAWITKMMKNRASFFFRTDHRRQKREKAVSSPDSEPSADMSVEKEEILQIVVEAVWRLEENYRKPILLRFYEGHSTREVAEKLNLTFNATQMRLKRGIEKVRKELTRKYNAETKSWILELAAFTGLRLIDSDAPVDLEGTKAAGSKRRTISRSATMEPQSFRKTGLFASLFLIPFLCILFLFYEESVPDRNEEGVSFLPATQTEALDSSVERRSSISERMVISSDPRDRSAKTVPISGRVISRDTGLELAGAQVVLSSLDLTAPIVTETGPNGWFLINAADLTGGEYEEYLLSISFEDYWPVKTAVACPRRDDRVDLGNYYLESDTVREICVKDPDGNPIGDAVFDFYRECSATPVVTKISNAKGFIRVSDRGLDRRRRILDNIALHVRAKEMADYYSTQIWGERSMPDEVVLEYESQWTGRVLEDSTGLELSGARIRIGISDEVLLDPIKSNDSLRTETDSYGFFALDKPVFEGRDGIVTIQADGYYAKTIPYGDFQSVFRLNSPTDTVQCRLVDGESGNLLPEFSVISGRGYCGVSDSLGIINLPVGEIFNGSGFTQLEAVSLVQPDDKRFFRGDANPSNAAQEQIVLPFNKMYRNKVGVTVLDWQNQPISGVKITMKTGGLLAKPVRYTDSNGMARFDFLYPEIGWAKVKGEHHENLHFGGGRSVWLDGRAEEQRLTIQSRMRSLIQNIRAMDSAGKPLKRVHLVGQCTIYEDEKIFSRWDRVTDDNGFFDVHLPISQVGNCCIKGKPSTRIKIDYETLQNTNSPILVFDDQPGRDRVIEIFTHDEVGKPVAGVRVDNLLPDDDPQTPNFDRTDADGLISIAVSKIHDHRITVRPFPNMKQNKWYMPEKEKLILHPDEDRIDVLMKLTTGVRVLLTPISNIEGSSGHECYGRLKSIDGTPIETERIITYYNGIHFLGVPDGKMLAIITTSNGKCFETPIFDIRDGGSVTTTIDVKP